MRSVYPFSAVLGNESAKTALLLLCVHPKIGSVLLIGKNGSGKTTLLQATADLLSEEGRKCAIVPTNCTLDRLLGGLSLEDAIGRGEKKPEKGILSQVSGDFLFSDRINALSEGVRRSIFSVREDHILHFERDGISYEEEIDFSFFASADYDDLDFLGTQADFIGMSVLLDEHSDSDDRIEMMRRRLHFESDPMGFRTLYQDRTESLLHQIREARARIPEIAFSAEQEVFIADLVKSAECPGHRGTFVLAEVSRAIAALEGRTRVIESDVIKAAKLVLPHRMRSTEAISPHPSGGESLEKEELVDQEISSLETAGERETEMRTEGDNGRNAGGNCSQEPEKREYSQEFSQEEPDHDMRDPRETDPIEPLMSSGSIEIVKANARKKKAPGYGRRRRLMLSLDRGREVGAYIPRNGIQDLSLMSTLRAAVLDHIPKTCEGPLVKVRAEHLREKKKESPGGAGILFLVDASASMGASKRMMLVKRMVFSILGDSYVHRDQVAVMIFKGERAKLVLPFTRSIEKAKNCLRELKTGGKTPLLLGLREALRCLRRDSIKNKRPGYHLVLISDGKNNVLPEGSKFEECVDELLGCWNFEEISMSVIDTERGFLRMGYAKMLAEKFAADYCRIDDFQVSGKR